MTHLANHCGPVAGGFGCDMGDLPAPPAVLTWILYGIALAGLVIGLHALVTGRLLVKFGKLREISTSRAARLVGLSLLVDSLASFEIGRGPPGIHLYEQGRRRLGRIRNGHGHPICASRRL